MVENHNPKAKSAVDPDNNNNGAQPPQAPFSGAASRPMQIIRPNRADAVAPLPEAAFELQAPVAPLPVAPAPLAQPAVQPAPQVVPAATAAVPQAVAVTPEPAGSTVVNQDAHLSARPIPPAQAPDNAQLKSAAASSIIRRPKRKLLALTAGVALLLIAAGIPVYLHVSRERAWERATAFYQDVDYESAGKELEGLSMPSDPKRLLVYSQTMLSNRRFDEALMGFQKLYSIEPSLDTKLIIGNIYAEQKEFDKAVDVYKELIAADAKYIQAYVNLTTLYKLQGRAGDAKAVAVQAVANNPGNITLHQLQVAVLLDQKGSPEYQAAVEGLRKVNPTDPMLDAIAG